MASFTSDLRDLDPDVFGAIQGEISRQRETLEMIASENFVPRAVLQAQGSVLTNKYAEGYPCLLYTSPSPRDKRQSRMPSSA